VIHLIGPGGAGKSTVAPHVAALLGRPALDLDRAFEAAHGNIDRFIEANGYSAYAAANVQTYVGVRPESFGVVAVSSGFMDYPAAVHPAIARLQRTIAEAPTTVLLLPSLDGEACVLEIVRRQATRPLARRRSPAREEAVIRERFVQYRLLPCPVVTTMQSPEAVAREVVAHAAASTRNLASPPVLSNEC